MLDLAAEDVHEDGDDEEDHHVDRSQKGELVVEGRGGEVALYCRPHGPQRMHHCVAGQRHEVDAPLDVHLLII